MAAITLTALCHFGMEAVTKQEVYDLGYDVTQVRDGQVSFLADEEGIVRANLHLRSAVRVMVQMNRFVAKTFEELFQGVLQTPWEDWISPEGQFPVTKATSVRSTLFSTRDIQSIVKKAVAERLQKRHHRLVLPETGESYPIRVTLLKDEVSLYLDTSGDSLSKRGYRKFVSGAPISESLAASMLLLSKFRENRVMIDPFCGSGTILIEAARMSKHIAPGLDRDFVAMGWKHRIAAKEWILSREEAYDAILPTIPYDIQGFDIDGRVLRVARENAKAAGVEGLIHFQERDIANFSSPQRYGFLITNPPYGLRLQDDHAVYGLYRKLGDIIKSHPQWMCFVISGFESYQQAVGVTAHKRRKLYNGMLKTTLYQYFPKTQKKER